MIKVEIDSKLIEAVEAIPITLRNGPLGKCLDSFARPIASQSGTMARSSRESGSRRKWSRKYKNNPAFQNDSKQHFGHKVGKSGIAVWIGATYPKGNKQQFVMPVRKGDTYTRYHWGKPGSPVVSTSRRGNQYIRTATSKTSTATFPKADRATVRGFNAAKSSAEQSFMAELNKQIKELKLG